MTPCMFQVRSVSSGATEEAATRLKRNCILGEGCELAWSREQYAYQYRTYHYAVSMTPKTSAGLQNITVRTHAFLDGGGHVILSSAAPLFRARARCKPSGQLRTPCYRWESPDQNGLNLMRLAVMG